MTQTTYSYSRLSSFCNCKMGYYLNYVLREENYQNIYSAIGTIVHDCLEGLQQGLYTREEILEKFDDGLLLAELSGLEFPADRNGGDTIRDNYVNSIIHALNHFEKYDEAFEIEKKIEPVINGVKMVGYIDLILYHKQTEEEIELGLPQEVTILDFKTSTKFATKDLLKHGRQLIVYAIAMEQLGYKVRAVGWNMLKYAVVQGAPLKKGGYRVKVEQRNKIEPGATFEEYVQYYDYDEFTVIECEEWIKDTANAIEALDEFDYWQPRTITKNDNFFCSKLCGVSHCCSAYKQFCRDYYNEKNQ